MNISLCIATYKRPDRLRAVLMDIAVQDLPPNEIIVVDNDPDGSARAIVDAARLVLPVIPLCYDVQPIKNISLTRNRTVELATGEWLAFIDDDERAPSSWLNLLAKSVVVYNADGALGPVLPQVPDDAPAWIRRGSFYDFPRMCTGEIIPSNRLRFGNVLLRGSVIRSELGPFDVTRGLTGGEDGELLSRLVLNGTKIIWCDEAQVHEPIERSRLSMRWLSKRALSGGQDFARNTLSGKYGDISILSKLIFFCQALTQSFVAILLTLISLPFGKHRAAYWLIKTFANLGKLSVFLGLYYREYA